jgi:hypothetical protein
MPQFSWATNHMSLSKMLDGCCNCMGIVSTTPANDDEEVVIACEHKADDWAQRQAWSDTIIEALFSLIRCN